MEAYLNCSMTYCIKSPWLFLYWGILILGGDEFVEEWLGNIHQVQLFFTKLIFKCKTSRADILWREAKQNKNRAMKLFDPTAVSQVLMWSPRAMTFRTPPKNLKKKMECCIFESSTIGKNPLHSNTQLLKKYYTNPHINMSEKHHVHSTKQRIH